MSATYIFGIIISCDSHTMLVIIVMINLYITVIIIKLLLFGASEVNETISGNTIENWGYLFIYTCMFGLAGSKYRNDIRKSCICTYVISEL